MYLHLNVSPGYQQLIRATRGTTDLITVVISQQPQKAGRGIHQRTAVYTATTVCSLAQRNATLRAVSKCLQLQSQKSRILNIFYVHAPPPLGMVWSICPKSAIPKLIVSLWSRCLSLIQRLLLCNKYTFKYYTHGQHLSE